MRKTIWGAMLFVSFCVLGCTFNLAGPGHTDTVEKTMDFSPGGRIVLSNVNGSIEIVTWDNDQVEMIATKKAKGSATSAQEKMDRVRIEIENNSDEIRIKTVYEKQKGWNKGGVSVRYELRVPESANLEIDNTNGKIHVDGIAGSVNAETTNGMVDLKGISGSIVARTTNGKIRAEILEHDGDEINCATTNGAIHLALPGDVRANLDAAVTNGSVSSELPLTINGKINRKRLKGSINGGGTLVKLRTTNGSISIDEAGY